MGLLDDNLSGYRARVRGWVHELDSTKSFWTNNFIDQQINVSYRRRCSQLVMAHEGYFTNIATRDIVADQATYANPAGFERLLKVEIVRSNGTTVPIERHERHYAANVSAASGVDNYTGNYRQVAGGILLEPTPNLAITGGLRIEYYGLPTLMAADGDSMHADFPRSFDELIILDVTVALFDSEGLFENGLVKSVLRMRQEWEFDFERYIDSRQVSTNKIIPFAPHFPDA